MDQSDARDLPAVRLGRFLFEPGRRPGEAVPALLQATFAQAAYLQPDLLHPEGAE